MKEKIFALLFVGLFGSAGFGMLFLSITPSLVEFYDMQRWYNTPATLIDAGLESSSSDGSTTYKSTARYHYRFNGREYQGNRVGISEGYDNVGDYQQAIAKRLQAAHKTGKMITIWVNPENPNEAIIDRQLRWEMLGFKMLFVVLFGGVGIIGFFVILKRSKFNPPEGITDKPWLLEEKWASPTIYSDGKSGMWGTWFFALFWNLVSLPVVFIIPKEINDGNHLALIGGLFPLIGAGILVAAIRKTLQWRRFGMTPLHMDPYPGAIGGHVGGYIDVPIKYDIDNIFKVSLNHVHSYVSGSGDNRSRKESIKWQDNGIAKVESTNGATRIWIRFDVPAGMCESQPSSDDYYLWRLTIMAELPGVDFSRNFEIPVFATGETSKYINQSTTESRASIEHKYEAIENLIDPVQKAGGVEWFQPMGRNIAMAVVLLVFGIVFGSSGWFLLTKKEVLMSVIFSAFGLIFLFAGLYTALNSLWVRVDAQSLCCKRYFFGVPVIAHTIQRSEIKGLLVEQGVTSGNTVYYNVFVKTSGGKKFRIAEGFKGKSEAELAKGSLEILVVS